MKMLRMTRMRMITRRWMRMMMYDSIGVDKDGDLQTIDIGELGILDCPAKADLAYGSVSAGREKWPFNVLFFFLK